MSKEWTNNEQRKIVGTWRLIEAKDRDSEKEPWQHTFGHPISGYFIYDVNGYASIQIMTNPPQPTFDPDKGPTPEEALNIFNNYIAYYGTYTLDETQRLLTCQVEGGLNPNDVGTEQPRPFEIVDDKLIIGNQTTWIRVLERV